jgi:hypothetical protein
MAQEAYDWYNGQQLGLGDLFLQELENGFDKLESRPEAYNKIRKDYRQLVLHTFPYVIVFKIIKMDVESMLFFTRAETRRKNSGRNKYFVQFLLFARRLYFECEMTSLQTDQNFNDAPTSK